MTNIVIKGMILKGYRDIADMHNNTVHAREKNEKLLFKLLRINENCEYGRRYGFKDIKTVEDYRRQVPITNYADYEEYVRRMAEDEEENVLTSMKIKGYAQSSGSVGKRKFIPLTQMTLNTYTKYTVTRMLAAADKYHREKTGKGLKPGRGMPTGPAYNDYLPNGMLCSNVPDVAGRDFHALFPYFISIPFTSLFSNQEIEYHYINLRTSLESRDTLFMFSAFIKDIADYVRFLENHWEVLCDDIETGGISELARATEETKEKLRKVLRPMPERAEELRREFRKGFDKTILKRIWPNLCVISGIGTSTFTPFTKILRNYTEGIPFDFSIYGASEGLVAACDELESPKQLVLVDGNYYEFIPTDNEDEIYSLDELEVGREYEIVVTNTSGFYRYKCGDVLKVLGYMNECPFVQFSYRKGQLLNLTGEKTTEEHMAAAVKEISKAAGCPISEWAVFNRLDVYPYRYVLLVENEAGKDVSVYCEEAHRRLEEINPRYQYFVGINKIDRLEIRNIKPGTNLAWRKKKAEAGAPITQVKPVRFLDTDEKLAFFLENEITSADEIHV